MQTEYSQQLGESPQAGKKVPESAKLPAQLADREYSEPGSVHRLRFIGTAWKKDDSLLGEHHKNGGQLAYVVRDDFQSKSHRGTTYQPLTEEDLKTSNFQALGSNRLKEGEVKGMMDAIHATREALDSGEAQLSTLPDTSTMVSSVTRSRFAGRADNPTQEP